LFPLAELHKRRKRMKANYAPQMLLKPISDESRIFHKENLQYMDGAALASLERKPLNVVMGFDPAWISQDKIFRGEAESRAYTVICTIAVDAGFNIYILDLYRKRCDRTQLVDEIWRQWEKWTPRETAGQQYDFKHLADEFNRKSTITGIFPNFKWLSNARNQSKEDRVQGSLDGLVKRHKLFIPYGAEWLEDEFEQFPNSETFDGLDAIVNAVKIAIAPMDRMPAEPRKSDSARWIDDLLSGNLSQSERTYEDAY
jgi:hypothetical protein